jgi:uncharacterized protein (UPF0212 family)
VPFDTKCPECGEKVDNVLVHRNREYHAACFRSMMNFEKKSIALSCPLRKTASEHS